MLRRTLLASVLALAPVAAVAQQKAAPKNPDEVAASLPIDVPEVISGGGWQDAGKAGIYRALVVVTPTASGTQARVYVQWIGVKADGSAPEVTRSLAIKDVTDRNLPNAQLALEADAENEAVVVVSSFDPKSQKPTVLAFKATKPGQIATTPVPKDYLPQTQAAPGSGAPSIQKK